VNNQLRAHCVQQQKEFLKCAENVWGISRPPKELRAKESALFRSYLAFSCACRIFSDDKDIAPILASASEAAELSLMLAMKGCGNTPFVILRQVIELTYKSIYFCTHPVELSWASRREPHREITHQFLLNYFSKTDESRDCETVRDAILRITEIYGRLSAHVHVQNTNFTSFSGKATASKAGKNFFEDTNKLLEQLIILLVIFDKTCYWGASASEQSLVISAIRKPRKNKVLLALSG